MQVLELYRGKKRVRYSIAVVIQKYLDEEKERVTADLDQLAMKEFITQDTFNTNKRYCNNILKYLSDSKQTKALIERLTKRG